MLHEPIFIVHDHRVSLFKLLLFPQLLLLVSLENALLLFLVLNLWFFYLVVGKAGISLPVGLHHSLDNFQYFKLIAFRQHFVDYGHLESVCVDVVALAHFKLLFVNQTGELASIVHRDIFALDYFVLGLVIFGGLILN